MRAHKGKASNYNSLKTQSIIDYITDYNSDISELLRDNSAMLNTDRATLKSIAAELETVVNQLNAGRGIY